MREFFIFFIVLAAGASSPALAGKHFECGGEHYTLELSSTDENGHAEGTLATITIPDGTINTLPKIEQMDCVALEMPNLSPRYRCTNEHFQIDLWGSYQTNLKAWDGSTVDEFYCGNVGDCRK